MEMTYIFTISLAQYTNVTLTVKGLQDTHSKNTNTSEVLCLKKLKLKLLLGKTMRTFEVKIVVNGCATCPYSTPDVYCEKIPDELLEELDGGMRLNMQNRYKITETCPMYKESYES